MDKRYRDIVHKKQLSELAKQMKKDKYEIDKLRNKEIAEWERYRSQHRTW